MLMTGGKAVVEAIRAAGGTHVFGLIGSSTMEVFDALYDCEDVQYVGVRDEAAAAHMADGYARISGRPGVALAGQGGPGTSNLVSGIAMAYLAYSPVVTISGLPSTEHIGRDAFQEIDQQAILKPITKRIFVVLKAERIPEFLKEAFRISMAGRRGPVHVDIPRDVLAQEIDVEIQNPRDYPVHTVGTMNLESLATVRDLLLGATAPVILAGGGVKWGGGYKQVLRLAEKLNIPITASAGHADVVPNDHPLYAGQVGPRGNAIASGLTRESDLILALGTRLAFNTTFYTYNDISKAAKIVQVDIDPTAVGRYFPVTLGIIGDAGAVASALADQMEEVSGEKMRWKDWTAEFQKERAAFWKERDSRAQDDSKPLSPDRVFGELRKALPRDAVVTLDAGNWCLRAADQLRYFEVPSLISPLDFAAIGFSYAAALGAKAAAPHRPVVSLSGDGGFGMTLSEIGTAVKHGLNVVAIVLDNGCWGAEKAYQRDFYGGRYIGSDLLNPRYASVAELYGARGYHVTQPGELSEAVTEALKNDTPAVVHVEVDPNAMSSFRSDAFQHRVAR